MEPEELRSRVAGYGHHAWLHALLRKNNGMGGEIV